MWTSHMLPLNALLWENIPLLELGSVRGERVGVKYVLWESASYCAPQGYAAGNVGRRQVWLRTQTYHCLCYVHVSRSIVERIRLLKDKETWFFCYICRNLLSSSCIKKNEFSSFRKQTNLLNTNKVNFILFILEYIVIK